MEPEVTPEIQPEVQPAVAAPNPAPETVTSPASVQKKSPKVLIGVVVAVLVLAAAGAGVYAMTRTKKAESPVAVATATPTPDSGVNATSLTLLSDLNLYYTDPVTPDPLFTPIVNITTYYSAGTFTEGSYAGYKRIVSIFQQDGPGQPVSDIFATKDDVSYYLVSTLVTQDSLASDQYYNTAKVKGVISIASGIPETIDVGSGYTLYVDAPNVAFQYDANSKLITLLKFDTNLTNFTKLSEVGGVTLYADNTKLDTEGRSTAITDVLAYRAGTSRILGIDKSGIAYFYNLSTPTAYANYRARLKAYNDNEAKTKKDSSNTTIVEYPHMASLEFSTTGFSATTPLYSSYTGITDGQCSIDVNTWVTKGITAADLKQVGTVNGLTVYAFADPKNPLLNKIFDYTINDYSGLNPGETGYVDANGKNLALPTRAEYAAKNPVLFVKDPWGRYEAVKENYYISNIGGCGKPVVYLYPTTPTKVSLQFTGAMKLTTDIPTYSNGWKVLAQPNGQLTDLQPSATDCSAFAKPAVGSEYAAAACASKTYPYIYWAGSGSNAVYPVHTDGWVVAAADLPSFMNKTLDSVGLSSTEKNDMLSYWLPELQKKGAAYYKIDFLQTAEMNKIAPMKVSPNPDSVFRLFLDWKPLTEKPAVMPVAQNLQKLVRNGFTMVEWGGLKR